MAFLRAMARLQGSLVAISFRFAAGVGVWGEASGRIRLDRTPEPPRITRRCRRPDRAVAPAGRHRLSESDA
jgi:hypothetical protein